MGKTGQNAHRIRLGQQEIVYHGATGSAGDGNSVGSTGHLAQYGRGIAIAPFEARVAAHIQVDLAVFGTVAGYGLYVDVAHFYTRPVDEGIAQNKAATPARIVSDGHPV